MHIEDYSYCISYIHHAHAHANKCKVSQWARNIVWCMAWAIHPPIHSLIRAFILTKAHLFFASFIHSGRGEKTNTFFPFFHSFIHSFLSLSPISLVSWWCFVPFTSFTLLSSFLLEKGFSVVFLLFFASDSFSLLFHCRNQYSIYILSSERHTHTHIQFKKFMRNAKEKKARIRASWLRTGEQASERARALVHALSQTP